VESGPTNSIPNLLSGLKDDEAKDVEYVVVTHIHLTTEEAQAHKVFAKVIVHPCAPHMINRAFFFTEGFGFS
jgi:glyoxylase-like metal-dependent hydrolase (beta-lactamase superfamily II)